MNYTGNPRHLRSHRRTSQRDKFRRHQVQTPDISEHPRPDICQEFQEQTPSHSGSEYRSIPTSASGERDSFDAKRRRLLEQRDWLGVDISAPINIYDIRAAKEQKRRANGPFMRSLFQEPSELTLAKVSSTQPPQSPSIITSRSSSSLRPQPTIPSLHSSHHGSGFVPSRHSSPIIAQQGSSPSKSTSTSSSWNLFARQDTPASDLKFIPESNVEGDFFPRAKSIDKDPSDMRNVWAMVEERKHDDRMLRMECGWGSQSGLSASQVSVRQRCQSVHAGPYIQESQGEIADEQSQVGNARDDISQEYDQSQQDHMYQASQSEYPEDRSESPEQQIQTPRLEISLPSHQTPVFPISVPRSVTPALEISPGKDMSGFSCKHEESENAVLEKRDFKEPILDVVEENDEEDDGIPWF